MSYQDSLAFCLRQTQLWEAERHGLIAAGWAPTCLTYFQKDAELQARFELGFQRGKDQLAIERGMKETPA